MRIYDLPRTKLLKILHRISDEGWIERLPGNGWTFRQTLTSRKSYEEGYVFRAVIEQQAMLLPSFEPNYEGFLEGAGGSDCTRRWGVPALVARRDIQG